MRLEFSKYEGTANDFLVVETAALEGRELASGEVVALCDRHRGVGGDGVLLVSFDEGRPAMRVVNADGSVPEMCGNGLRCVVAHLARTGRVTGDSVVVDTDAGPHACRVELVDGNPDRSARAANVQVVMRVPSLVPADVPVLAETPLRDAPFDVDGRLLHVTTVSIGNPHLVTFDALAEPADRLVLGPRLERDARFPDGVNVGFAQLVAMPPTEAVASGPMRSPTGIRLYVFERGAGWTEACGTGACAAAVAAVETGRLPRGVTIPVMLPGGTLEITVGAADEPVRMRGPARFVFAGSVELHDDWDRDRDSADARAPERASA